MRNQELSITMPCHWNDSVLDKVLQSNLDAVTPVREIYGVLADGGPIKHGRSPDVVVQVNRQQAIQFREKCRDGRINFTYLLNAPFNFTGDLGLVKDVDAYLDWVVDEFKADAVTISSHKLMKHVRTRYPDLPIHISTIAGVRNVKDLSEYLDVNPNRVVPHHDLGKKFGDLEGIVSLGDQHGIDVELLATESCLFSCPNRVAHYQNLACGSKDTPFHTTCNTTKLEKPRQLLMAGGVIRPEDMSFYGIIGVKHIKLSGRSKPAEWIPEVVEAYQNHSYDGNLIRLLGIDPSLNAEEWMHLDNKSLEGFIQGYPQESVRAGAEYCDQWMVKLHQEGRFSLSDGTTYREQNSQLVLNNIGVRAIKILDSEK
ncbi:MAG: U32 family peptidase [Candidatus Shapirobacteria bacterium]|nr:U32 family peptidase [Candidatus Shapirobacteria bacterium]